MNQNDETTISLLNFLSERYYTEADFLFIKNHFKKYQSRSLLNSQSFASLVANSPFNFNVDKNKLEFFYKISLIGVLKLTWEELLDKNKFAEALKIAKQKVEIHSKLENYFAKKINAIFKITYFSKLSAEIRKLDDFSKKSLLITTKELQDDILSDLELYNNLSLFYNIHYKEIIEYIRQALALIKDIFSDENNKYKWLNLFLLNKAYEAAPEKVILPDGPIGYIGAFTYSFEEIYGIRENFLQDYRLDFSSKVPKVSKQIRNEIEKITNLIETIPNHKVVSKHFNDSLQMLSGKEIEGFMYLKAVIDLINKKEPFVYKNIDIGYELVETIVQLKELDSLVANNYMETFDKNGKLMEILINTVEIINSNISNESSDLLSLFQLIIDAVSACILRGIDPFFKVNNISVFDFVTFWAEIIDFIDGAFPGGMGDIFKACLQDKTKNSSIYILERVNRFIDIKFSILNEILKKGEAEYLTTIKKHFKNLWLKISLANKIRDDELDMLLLNCIELLEKTNIFPENSIKLLGEFKSDNVQEYFLLLARIIINHIVTLESAEIKVEQGEEDDFQIMENILYRLLIVCFAGGIDFSIKEENRDLKFEVSYC